MPTTTSQPRAVSRLDAACELQEILMRLHEELDEIKLNRASEYNSLNAELKTLIDGLQETREEIDALLTQMRGLPECVVRIESDNSEVPDIQPMSDDALKLLGSEFDAQYGLLNLKAEEIGQSIEKVQKSLAELFENIPQEITKAKSQLDTLSPKLNESELQELEWRKTEKILLQKYDELSEEESRKLSIRQREASIEDRKSRIAAGDACRQYVEKSSDFKAELKKLALPERIVRIRKEIDGM